MLEEILVKIAHYVYDQTKLDNLCFAGGVALNSVANWKILKQTKFKNIYIQPAAGDSGGALGAALWVHNTVLSKKRNFVMEHAFWGESESKDQTEKVFKEKKIKYKQVIKESNLIDEISDEIKKGKVIGWVQDRFEWGPRALGHRSILADPRNKKMKYIVNQKIKFREAFRPFAPSVIKEKAKDYFLIGDNINQYPFKFMLYVVPVAQDKQKNLQAITHVDGTARPQLVDKSTNPRYYNLIKAFGNKTGIPVLLNTSFNLKGEPIVNTTEQALKTFNKSGLDILVIDNLVVKKKN